MRFHKVQLISKTFTQYLKPFVDHLFSAGVKALSCFVIMAFGNPKVDKDFHSRQNSIYDDWILPAVEECLVDGMPLKMKCLRADKELRPGDIITDVVKQLLNADIVIADLSRQNPNVFYELGVRHALKNRAVLIADDLAAIPFDLRGQRAFSYQYDPSGMLQLRKHLQQSIKNALKDESAWDNPVRRFLIEDGRFNRQSSEPKTVTPSIESELAIVRSELGKYSKEITHMRELISALTVAPTPPSTVDSIDSFEQFIGFWSDTVSGSLFYAELHEGNLLMPYCYSNNHSVLGVAYNFKLIGSDCFFRFKWVTDSKIWGYGHVKIESKSMLSGGWWYGHDVPTHVANDVTNLVSFGANSLLMNRLILRRESKPKRVPEWFVDFFRRADQFSIFS